MNVHKILLQLEKKKLVLIKLKVVENFQFANGARTHIQSASKNVWHKRKKGNHLMPNVHFLFHSQFIFM